MQSAAVGDVSVDILVLPVDLSPLAVPHKACKFCLLNTADSGQHECGRHTLFMSYSAWLATGHAAFQNRRLAEAGFIVIIGHMHLNSHWHHH